MPPEPPASDSAPTPTPTPTPASTPVPASTPAPPLRGPGSDRRRTVFFGVWAVVLVAIVVVFREVMLPFILAAVLAYVFAPIIDWLERLKVTGRSAPRWVVVLVFYLVLLGLLTGIGALSAPRLGAETQKLAQGMPRIVSELERVWMPRIEDAVRSAIAPYGGGSSSGSGGTGDDGGAHARATPPPVLRVTPRPDGAFDVSLPDHGVVLAPQDDGTWVVSTGSSDLDGEGASVPVVLRRALERGARWASQYAGEAIRTVQIFVRSLVRGVFFFFLTLMLSAYMLITRDRIFAFLRGLVRAERLPHWDSLITRVDRGLSGVVRGQLIICVVNGALSAIGFWALDLQYWPVLALIATVLSIIPIFGAILSSVPAIAVALHDGVGTALLALAWVVGIHQLEANLLNPKIMGDAAKVHPVLVVFALLAGEHMFGVAGALLAVPALSILQSLFLHFRTVALGEWREDEPPAALPPAT